MRVGYSQKLWNVMYTYIVIKYCMMEFSDDRIRQHFQVFLVSSPFSSDKTGIRVESWVIQKRVMA
jgi:hypothetical protein